MIAGEVPRRARDRQGRCSVTMIQWSGCLSNPMTIKPTCLLCCEQRALGEQLGVPGATCTVMAQ